MSRLTRLAIVIVATLITGCLALSQPVQADGGRALLDLPLIPIERPGSIHLTACTVRIDLQCEGEVCAVVSRQTYRIRNESREPATLRVGLPVASEEGAASLDAISLQQADGSGLAPTGSDVDHQAIWELGLPARGQLEVVLETRHSAATSHLLRWRWNAFSLEGWGNLEGVRVVFRLPVVVSESAFLQVQPGAYRFDGQSILWEYENLTQPVQHEVLLYAPPTWLALRDLRQAGSHRELARLYSAIDGEGRASSYPVPDHYSEAVGVLQAALVDHPEDAEARIQLVDLYRDRAASQQSMQLNYLMLAAEEIEQLLERNPSDTSTGEMLARAYYDIALAAEAQGNPAMALDYLRKATTIPAVEILEISQTQRELGLRWAVELAQRGSVVEVLTELESELSPAVLASLVQYAPPLLSAHADVELSPSARMATYQVQFYPLTRAAELARLRDQVSELDQIEGVTASLEAERNPATIQITASYDTLQTLAARGSAIVAALSEGQLLGAFLATPWRGTVEELASTRLRWKTHFQYREQADCSLPDALWQEQYQYVEWRLVELQNATPEDEVARLEQELAILALTEQRELWKRIPASSHLSYRLADGMVDGGGGWLVRWGQSRLLEAEQTHHNWPLLRQAGTLLAACLGLIVVLVAALTSRPRRR